MPFAEPHRLQALADTAAERTRTANEHRHIGAQPGAQFRELIGIQTAAPGAVEHDQHGRRVRTAAAQPRADRHALDDFQLCAAGRARLRLQQPRRADHQVVILGHAVICAGASQSPASIGPYPHLVAPVQDLEQGLEFMVAVGPPAGHVQEQVQLGRRRPADRDVFTHR